jgi:hypothetical protein
MKDINGQELREGGSAQLLCEILSIEDGQIVLRVMNSDTTLAVGTKHDEVLGGLVADSELTAFDEVPSFIIPSLDNQADGLKAWPME